MLDSLIKTAAQYKKDIQQPLLDYSNQLAIQRQNEKALLDSKLAEQALNKVIALEQQRQAAGEPPQIPYRQQTFGLPEELSLYQAYGQAGIDPVKRAEAKTARLKAQAFAEALPTITDPAAKINIGMGKEYQPVSYSGGVFFDQYDPDNPLLDTTGKYQHETALAKTKADEAKTKASEAIHQLAIKQAEAETAKLKAQAFAETLPTITDPAARINIGMGKEYQPVSYSGGVFFDQYDPDNPLLDTTGKYQHETALAKTKADEAKSRLDVTTKALDNPELHPLLAVDIAQNKPVFDAQEVTIEGADGKTRQGMARLTPTGDYVGTVIKDATGQPLNIPPESGDSATLQKAKEMVQYGRAENIKEALTILTSTLSDTPEKAWTKIVNDNTKNPFTGKRLPGNEIISNAIEQWTLARPGESFPETIVKTINQMELSDPEKEKILASITRYNDAFKIPEAAPTVIPAFNSPPQSPVTPAPPPVSAAAPELPAIPAAIPAATPEQQPLTPVAIQASWAAIQQGKKPEEVQQALTEQGFDISPESVNRMAIDAVNSGVPANVLQQYLSSIGIEWQPD